MRTSRILLSFLSFFLILALTSCSDGNPLPFSPTGGSERASERSSLDSQKEIRALWVSQFDLSPICVDEGAQRERSDYTQRVDQILDNVCSLGINTLFVQVRPNGDSFYPSELFPASPYAVGRIGTDFAYDPFGVLLTMAHEKGLSVHAWINPLRCFTEANRQRLTGEYPIWDLFEKEENAAVLWENVWYLNPANASSRALIANGVAEILRKYPVDGIHLDDYFYPTQDPAFDESSYREEGNGRSLGDFRREQINRLMRELKATVRSIRPDASFGVSPGGNTRRNYYELYADVAAWCRERSVDYVCPQLYFGLEHKSVPFEAACMEFSKMAKEGGVALLIGMTLGKAYDGYYGKEDRYAGEGAREWIERTDVLARCLTIARSTPEYCGVSFFSYQYFFSPENGERVVATAKECAALLPLLGDS